MREDNLIVGRLDHSAASAVILGDEVADEITHVGLGLKADQIVLQQQGEQLLVVRQHGDHFRRGEGDMEKETNAIGKASAAKLVRHRYEVVVVHPDDIVGPQQL